MYEFDGGGEFGFEGLGVRVGVVHCAVAAAGEAYDAEFRHDLSD